MIKNCANNRLTLLVGDGAESDEELLEENGELSSVYLDEGGNLIGI